MSESRSLLSAKETLTTADHQTHRRYPFDVPSGCAALRINVAYSPKYVDAAEAAALLERAVSAQAARLERQVSQELITEWVRESTPSGARIPNLLTISLDDPSGAYRGAGHRQASEQLLLISETSASPGLVQGPLHSGRWFLTLSAHTLVSPECSVSIQIGAEIASSLP